MGGPHSDERVGDRESWRGQGASNKVGKLGEERHQLPAVYSMDRLLHAGASVRMWTGSKTLEDREEAETPLFDQPV